MKHDEIRDLLEGYVDETLDRETRREVDAHLATCEECRAILEGVAPVELGEVGGVWDERGLQRAVRRSILRVAADALLLLFAGWLVAWLLSLLILQPLVLNRGGRAVAATIGTVDLAVMENPGAAVDEYSYRSGWLTRTSEVDLVLPVGSAAKDLGTIDSRIGVVGFGDVKGGRLVPRLSDETDRNRGEESLRAVDEGTVATVALRFERALEVEAAQAMIDSDADVSVIWAGFEAAGDQGSELAPAGVLGYSTCGSHSVTVSGAAGSSGGGSGTSFGAPASVTGALVEIRRAVGNLIDNPELLAGLGATVNDATEALQRLESPRVVKIVVTGPTTEILRFVDEVGPDAVSVLEIEFMNWSEPPCGR